MSVSPDDKLRRRITTRVTECIDACRPLCGRRSARLPTPQIRFDLRGGSAGQCLWRTGHTPVLRFNLTLARANGDDFVTTTVAHEVAHLVTLACHGRTPPHGTAWRSVMRHLGIDAPQRCHGYPVADMRRQRRWPYRCACREHELTTTRHNRVQRRDAEYICRHCGERLRCAIDPDNSA